MSEPAVAVAGLRRDFGERVAVDGVSVELAAGQTLVVLGPNGAGKTTTIGILTTRVKATSGVARVSGIDVSRDPVSARARLSVVPTKKWPGAG